LGSKIDGEDVFVQSPKRRWRKRGIADFCVDEGLVERAPEEGGVGEEMEGWENGS